MRIARAPTGVESHKDRGGILRESSIPCLVVSNDSFFIPTSQVLNCCWINGVQEKCVVEINDSQESYIFFVLCMTCLLQTHSLNLESRGTLLRSVGPGLGCQSDAFGRLCSNPSPRQGLDAKHFVADGDRTCFSTNSPVSSFSFSMFFSDFSYPSFLMVESVQEERDMKVILQMISEKAAQKCYPQCRYANGRPAGFSIVNVLAAELREILKQN